jgi:D-glycero-alpha-D-manno-heptose-7-phosphate kinase
MSYVGGGTDINAFYKDEPGAVVSTSINKYMYITVHEKFDKGIRIAYSSVEEVDKISDIKHPLVRECLKLTGINGGIEITSTADIPGKGTGLGSSSSYTVGLLNALNAFNSQAVDIYKIASDACEIEIDKCKEPIGKQDQFAAAFGGLKIYEFMPDESVKVIDIDCSNSFKSILDQSSISFYLGTTRSASKILEEQTKVSSNKDKKLILRRMADIAREFKTGIEISSFEYLTDLMNENWELKKSMTSHISNSFIDEVYKAGINSGAKAGKLLGAGGGGFVTFLAPKENHPKIRKSLKELKEVSLRMENGGTQIIYNEL